MLIKICFLSSNSIICFINGDEPLSFPNAVWEWTKMQSSRFAEAAKVLQAFQKQELWNER